MALPPPEKPKNSEERGTFADGPPKTFTLNPKKDAEERGVFAVGKARIKKDHSKIRERSRKKRSKEANIIGG
jgi:hypothetical protein